MQGYLASGAYSPTAMLYIALLCCRSERLCHPRVPARPETEDYCESSSPRHRSSHYCLIKSLGVSSHMQMQEPSNRGRRCRQDRLYTQHVYLAVRVIGLRFAGHTSPRASSHTHAYSSHDLAAISQSLTIFHLHISCSPSQWQSLLRPP
jgi:hypothetical protein